MSEIRTFEASYALSGTTQIKSFAASAALSKLAQVKSFSASAKLKHVKSFSASALITDTKGTFRGSMTTADRDALPALQPQDTVLTIDAENASSGINVPRMQFWTGSDWLSGYAIASPVSGVTNLFTAPTTAGWRVEEGDPTYPIRYWNGSTTNFSVDDAGDVSAVGTITAGSFIGGSIDVPAVGSTGLHVDSSGNIGIGGTTSTNGKVVIAYTDPGATQYQTIFMSNIQTGGLLLFSRSGPSSTTMWTKTNPTDANELFAIRQDGRLKWGDGGASATDTTLYRSAANTLQVGTGDSFLWGATSAMRLDTGNLIEWKAITAPSTPGSGLGRTYFSSVDKKLHVIDDAGTNTALGAGGGGTTLATDTLWAATGDIVYGTGNDTAAVLSANSSATKKYLQSFSSGAPSWAQVAYSEISGTPTITTLANDTLWAAAGDVVYGTGNDAAAILSANSTGTNKFLRSVSSGNPTWTQPAYTDITGTPTFVNQAKWDIT